MVSLGPVGTTPIIKDNTIVFWSISQEDYDALLAKDPEVANRMEELMEYYHNALEIASELRLRGFTVIFGSWEAVSVQISERQTKEIAFNPKDFKAILMKAIGKEPKMVTKFFGEYSDMLKIISEYFNIDLSF